MSDYTLTVTIDAPPEEAEQRVRAALANEGFGILSEIDVRATLEHKLGEDIGPYRILGACNPPLARDGLAADADLGALLPCNVVVRANPEGGTDVVAADPVAMLALAGQQLSAVASQARAKIERALQEVASG